MSSCEDMIAQLSWYWFSVAEIVAKTTIEMAVTVTVSTEEILETMIDMVVASEERISRYRN